MVLGVKLLRLSGADTVLLVVPAAQPTRVNGPAGAPAGEENARTEPAGLPVTRMRTALLPAPLAAVVNLNHTSRGVAAMPQPVVGGLV